jgi:ABC-type amino acid transport substrate-binding protein
MELFIVSTVYTDRVRVVLGGMHLFCLTIVAVSISKGLFKVNLPRLAQTLVVSIIVILVSLLGVRAYLANSIQGNYEGDVAITHMNWMDRPIQATHYRENLPEPDVSVTGEQDRMATIQKRGRLRVGYLPDSLPFAFVNHVSEVVGFDIELAHNFAKDLNVKLELIRVEKDQINKLLDSGQLDIVMSGLAQTPERMMKWRFAGSPMDLTLALLVPDHRRKEFATVADVRLIQNLTLGIGMQDSNFEDNVRRALPDVSIQSIASPRTFLRGKEPEVDAVVYSAEGGSAWTLIYPGYSVILPWPSSAKRPVGYPVPNADPAWQQFVSTWVDLKKKDGTVDRLYAHWILGGGALSKEPRWSVIRNVLHWVD